MKKFILKIGVFIIPLLLMATTSTWGATVSLTGTDYHSSDDLDTVLALDLAYWGSLSSYTNLADALTSGDQYIISNMGNLSFISTDYSSESTDNTTIDSNVYYFTPGDAISGNFEALVIDSTATPEPETYATLLVIFGIGALMYRRQKKGALQGLA